MMNYDKKMQACYVYKAEKQRRHMGLFGRRRRFAYKKAPAQMRGR